MTTEPNNNCHLSRIKVKGFKSIKSLDLAMKPINILLGTNGSGKSNFISLFKFLNKLASNGLDTYVSKNGGANALMHFGSGTSDRVEIDLQLGGNGYHVEFGCNTRETLVFEREFVYSNKSGLEYLIKGSKNESGLFVGSHVDKRAIRNCLRDGMEDFRTYHFYDTGPTAPYKLRVSVDDCDGLYEDFGNIAPFLYYLKTEYPDNYNNIVEVVKRVIPYFDDFILNPSNGYVILRWHPVEHNKVFSANQLSGGAARFICLAALFLQPQELKPKILIVDDPDLGLNKVALEVLADFIQMASVSTQVICSTQSVEFARLVSYDDVIMVDQQNCASEFCHSKLINRHMINKYGANQ